MTRAADDPEAARLVPGSEFKSPGELGESPGLSREQKIDHLQRRAEDARELDVAESQGMAGGGTFLFARILSALASAGECYGT